MRSGRLDQLVEDAGVGGHRPQHLDEAQAPLFDHHRCPCLSKGLSNSDKHRLRRWTPTPIGRRRNAVTYALLQSNIVPAPGEAVASKLMTVLTTVALTVAVAAGPGHSATAATPSSLQEVMFVGNNWDGTVDVI